MQYGEGDFDSILGSIALGAALAKKHRMIDLMERLHGGALQQRLSDLNTEPEASPFPRMTIGSNGLMKRSSRSLHISSICRPNSIRLNQSFNHVKQLYIAWNSPAKTRTGYA